MPQKTLDLLEEGWKLYNKKARDWKKANDIKPLYSKGYHHFHNPFSPNTTCHDISCNSCFLCEECEECFDCLNCSYGEHFVNCVNCSDGLQVHSCVSCTDIHCCINCTNLKHGLLCVDLHLEEASEESFWVANQKVSREEWEKITDEFYK